VFAHRLVLTAEAGVRETDPGDVVGDVLDSVSVPGVDGPSGDGRG
jgi:MoxR-like ATPase